jgi:Wiskott-Aldrich syndrome protein
MAPSGLLTAEDKAKVKKAIPTSGSTNKIITAGVARVYYAKPDSSS